MTDPTDPTDPANLAGVLSDAHAFYRSPRVLDPSWVPDHLNRRNLYAQLKPAGIGYAPPGWTILTDHLRRLGHPDGAIEAAGLARTASTGRLVDRFRDRLIIPVTDTHRRLVGFLGRAPDTAAPDTPKYLNSPTSDLYSKSRLLYGLGDHHAALKAGALPILVEGPIDRLAINAAARHLSMVGLAPCGTALTSPQAQQLVDAVGTRRPIAVAFDHDRAGQAAAARAWERLTDAGATNLLHVTLPPGKDPADLVRAGRHQQLRHAIVTATPLPLAVADHTIAAAGKLDHLHKRVALLTHLLDRDLPRVPVDLIGRYLTHLAQRLDLDHADITAAAAEQLAPTTRNPDTAEAFSAHILTAEGFPEEPSPSARARNHLHDNHRGHRGAELDNSR